ncbi:amidohydrolase [Paenibacillus thiaminolyticus]|uniref:amidohydrolase family protein n=1 Tax=Paenibacillus thiaminolyticus TaxID=49283 RepID=UPI0011649A82|nr:amidohydrolase [Paenibacillus thiaminolyticus]
MRQVWLKNGWILTMDGERRVFQNGDVLIENDRIKAIGAVDPSEVRADAEVVELNGKTVMPGLINTHVHTMQQLGRGIADDVDLLTWLYKRVFPYESCMTEEEAYLSALACSLELIRSGVTTFAEAGGKEVNGIARAVQEAGIRAVLCRATMDMPEGLPEPWQESTEHSLAVQEELFDSWHGKADGRLRVWFGLRTIFNCSDELIVRTKELADRHGVGIHMHVAEIPEEIRFVEEQRGRTTVEHLAHLGVLGPNMLAVHTVWMTDREIDLFRLHDVKVSHNPAAAMRVLGFARIPEMLERGITVSIATDGAPCNNRMDMIDEMLLTALIHKGRTLTPTKLPAVQVLEMATVNGARCLGWDDEIGSLEAGKKADLIIINPRSAGVLPVHDPVSTLVYAMHSSNVESSMCNGQWIMKDRRIVTLDEDAILDRVQDTARAIVERAGIELPPPYPVTKVR